MKKFQQRLVALAFLAVAAQAGAVEGAAGDHAAVRIAADVMSEKPLVEIGNAARAWAVEKSEDFGVVLIEVTGDIPLHMHPDGNRRMFVIEGGLRMLGGDREMVMKPGDYMYLPREHHHEVWLAPGAERALFLLVDNPPTSIGNVVWLDPRPDIGLNPDQAKSALRIGDRCEAAPTKASH